MHDKMVENDTTNTDPTIKQEMQVDTETVDVKTTEENAEDMKIKSEDMKIKTVDMKIETVDITDEDMDKSSEIITKNEEKTELLSNTLKRKRVRGKIRGKRRRKEWLLASKDSTPGKKETDSQSTSETEKPSDSAPPGVEETTVDVKTYDDVQDDVEYVLTVSNLPNTWSFMDIKNYIDTECEPVDEMELVKDKKTGNGAIRLSYQSQTQAKNTMNKLKDKVIDGHKLTVDLTVETLESDTENTDEPSETTERAWKPDMDDWDIDPKGLYGLKEEFLKSLNIQPPLDRWVGVTNFRCDKSQIREIMELAGEVLHISMFSGIHKYATVMYTHPLEAVQAVSMLNKQQFFGQTLHINIIRAPSETVMLPKGLTGIGQGLGINGKPLRNVKKHYRKLMTKEQSLVNPEFFDVPENLVIKVPDVNFKTRGVEILDKSFDKNLLTNTETAPKPTPPAAPQIRPQAKPQIKPQNQPQIKPQAKPQNTIPIINRPQVPRPNHSPNMQHNFPRPTGPFPRPNMVRPMGAYGPGPRPMGPYGPGPRPMGPYGNGWNNVGTHVPGPMGAPGPMGGPMRGPMAPMQGQGPMGGHMMYNNNEPVQLQLSNLPPSTTFNILCEKMAQCGQVVSIQLTTPGCAVVTFANRMQADHCIKTYNGAFVDGCTIQVKYT